MIRDSGLRATVLADYAAGMSCASVGAKWAISPSTVNKWAREAGITRSHGAGRHAAAQERRDLELGLGEGHWMPDGLIQRWYPCFFASAQECNINHQASAA